MDEDKNQLNPNPPTPPEPVNTMPEGVETFDPKQPSVSNINQRADEQFVAKDIGFSTNTEEKTNSRYEGPVTQASYDSNEMTQSYNSTTSTVKKSHARQYKMLALVILVALLLGVGALIFLIGDSSSSNSSTSNENQSEQVSEEDNSAEELPLADTETEETDESPEEEPVNEVSPEQADVTRKIDINSMYQKLEEFFNDNGYYPTDKFSETLFTGADPESFLDSEGVRIAQQIQLGITEPSSPFTAEKPVGSQYRYIAYKCTSSVPAESKCNSYAIFSWLETDPAGYSKLSLN